MRIKTFTADTMPEALRLIRQQLGPEALILSTRKVQRNGVDTLEITAAVNEEDRVKAAALPRPEHMMIPQGEPVSSGKSGPAIPDLCQSTLQAHGVPHDLVATLQAAMPGLIAAGFTEAEALAMLLGKKLKFSESTGAGGVQVFIGPHGAGKTTLVAKLALMGHQQRRKVGMISLDDQKIGGFEPLAIAADLLGDHAHLVANSSDLRTAAASLGPRDALLIDTAGINILAPRAVAQLRQRLEDLALPAQVNLVIPANLNAEDMQMLPLACRNLQPCSLIFTKLDCTSRYGALMATAMHSGLPLGLATHAADLATPPVPLNPQWLAEALLQLPRQAWEFAKQQEGWE